jgi:hypothetical protein
MIYTYVGTNKYRFEIIKVQRQLTPIQSVLYVETMLFGPKGRYSGLLKCAQVPCQSSFYEIETIQFQECYIELPEYEQDLKEFMQYLQVFIPKEVETYDV